MSTMKVHEKPPIVRPFGRLKLVSVGLALAVALYCPEPFRSLLIGLGSPCFRGV